jgi:multisubunit Na+/H+ antiporter MnhE subunit
MPKPSRPVQTLRRAAAWSAGWLFAAALYLLLIDTTDLPELIVGVVAAGIAATAFELAREQHIAGETIRARWLGRLYRPLVRVPRDVALVCAVALRQLLHRQPVQGEFRAVRFACGEDEALEVGRRALAESFGSFAPNTIIVGVDADRQLILAHQLWRTEGRKAIDVLELG